MQPATYNFDLPAASSLLKTFTYKRNGAAVNLSGYTAKCQIRTSFDATAVILELSSANSGILLNNPTGSVILSASDTSISTSLVAGKYIYDIKLVSGAGFAFFLVGGSITITKTSTR